MNDTQKRQPWPYEVNYNKESEIETDVLILGGGIAGCHAAISAAKKGANVTIVEKGPIIRSGDGGAGVDHWHNACTNPCSRISPEEMVETVIRSRGHVSTGEFGTAASFYIMCRESYDALLDMENMGIKIRDEENEFEGAAFRDDETRLMFAYDYKNRFCIRVAGAKMKPALYKELKRLGVNLVERVMAKTLLTEESSEGKRVKGAIGFSVRTGEFYVFRSKATILSMSFGSRLWVSSTEFLGAADSQKDPNLAGDGVAMAWKAGAEFTLMEASMPSPGAEARYLPYTTGNAHNTWYACNIVDANGKQIPWENRDGNILESIMDRYYPAHGQKMFIYGSGGLGHHEIEGPKLISDLPERIKKGEYKLPFFADLPSMPETERRAIFGLMIGNEGKTLVPVYKAYADAGFDPDIDMLQVNVMPLEAAGRYFPWWTGVPHPQGREMAFGGGGGLVYDWDLQTNMQGLFAAGSQLAGGSDHSHAAATGRYAGRKAAELARRTGKSGEVNREIIEAEKKTIYAPVNCPDGFGWKEFRSGLNRIMRDYCSTSKSEETLKMGLRWVDEIKENEAQKLFARNPHDLMRTMECFSRLTVAEMVFHACLARRASNSALGFHRLDYPEVDPPEWDKFVTLRLEKDKVKVDSLPPNYWLLSPNAPTYKENYEKHSGL